MSDTNLNQDNTVIEPVAMSDADFLKHFDEQVAAVPVESKSPEVVATEVVVPPVEALPEESTVAAETVVEVNHKEFYERMTKPFKANGREIHVTNPDDMITLMQKGSDYVKKMTELKPLKRIGKLLEENQLEEADLAFLIDLKNKKPEAIAKLLKDSEVDMYGFDVEQGNDYTPVAPQVAEVNDELQSTLDELQATSATFNQTIAVVGQQWDVSSRETIAQHPQLLRILDAQIANGTFAKIDNVVQYEKLMGRLSGMTDMQAYVEIERRLQASSPQPIQTPAAVVPPVAQPTQQQQKVAEQRKSAAPPRVTQPDSTHIANPSIMSDAEFKKFMASQGIL